MKNLVVSCVLCGAVAASSFAAPEAGSAAKRPPSESPAEGRAPAAAPTAESLLAKAKEASGGAAWDRVATLHVRAKLATSGLEGTTESFDDLSRGRTLDRFILGSAEPRASTASASGR